MKKAHRKHLNDRDLQILEFVNRYRVGTVKLLAHDVFGTTDNLKNVRRVLRRLERRGLLLQVFQTPVTFNEYGSSFSRFV